jgi:hypothetical protein
MRGAKNILKKIVVRVTKSRMRGLGHVACMVEIRKIHKIWLENLKEQRTLWSCRFNW